MKQILVSAISKEGHRKTVPYSMHIDNGEYLEIAQKGSNGKIKTLWLEIPFDKTIKINYEHKDGGKNE